MHRARVSTEGAIPELETNRPGPGDDLERAGHNVLNTFTVDRDTSVAQGAGWPGPVTSEEHEDGKGHENGEGSETSRKK